MHHLESPGLGLRRKILLHVELPEGLAEHAVGRLHAALPARQDFLRARQRLAAEIKVLGDEFFSEPGCRRIHQMPTQVSFPVVDGCRGQLRVEGLKKVRLSDVDFFQFRMSRGLEIRFPGKIRRERFQVR